MTEPNGESGEGGGSDREVTTSDIVRYLDDSYQAAGLHLERLVVLQVSQGVYQARVLEKGQSEEEAFFVQIGPDA